MRMGGGAREKIRGLYAIIDAAYVAPEDAAKTCSLIIGGGCRLIQLRAKGAPRKDFLKTALEVRAVTSASGAAFIINDDIGIALEAKADGAHIGQTDAPLKEARAALGRDAIIGVSTHNAAEAVAAQESGAGYVSFGPVFPTRSKPDADVPKGLPGLAELRRRVRLPIAAIGGITAESAAGVIEAGADAVAIISGILLCEDITSTTAAFIREINRGRH
ncbi:MAG: thiamine phosphate synthase [Deltaproteobacteria bacterium]|nr:thiamine phosphate synthase [Deltaproteobacteria bacterium]